MNLEFLHDEQSICALATPAGRSGVALLRLSGTESYNIVRKLCSSLPATPTSHRLYFSRFRRLRDHTDIVDEVLVSFFSHGKSYTGEESVEISCHGNPVVIKNILKELVLAGSRPAGPGEFTYRAFKNSNIDLVQAESVLNLIEADSERSASLSYRQLAGELSGELSLIEDKLIFLVANFEASIDFTEEDIEIVDYPAAEKAMQSLIDASSSLLKSYNEGRIIKDGLQVALVGPPNVGKSSILNAITKEEKAIVSNIPGTTRDIVEATIQWDGLNIHFLDTAGLRNTDDEIEKLGIQRSQQAVDRADLCVLIIDASKDIDPQLDSLVDEIYRENSILAVNKLDLVKPENRPQLELRCRQSFVKKLNSLGIQSKHDGSALILCSAVVDPGIEPLVGFLRSQVEAVDSEDNAVIQQARHFDLLNEMRESMLRALGLIKQRDSVEFISADLHAAIYKLHEVLGKKFDDEVMDRVFKEFCIGK